MFIVQIAGRLGKDPETRFTPSGQKVTSFNIATNQRKGKEDVTVWVRVTVWGERLDKILSYLKKGSAAIVIGRMNPPSTYVDKEGRSQVTLEVTAEMVEFSPFGNADKSNESGAQESTTQGNGNGEGYAYSQNKNQQSSSYGSFAPIGGQSSNDMDDDNLPF
jgi:single-strand DNA-binding protein